MSEPVSQQQRRPLFPEIYLPALRDVRLPEVYAARLTHRETAQIEDPAAAVEGELDRSAALAELGASAPGATVAVAVGSRGIAGLADVVSAAVGWLRRHGLSPRIVPAMGSHGGADGVVQRGILEALGVSEQRVGAPIVSSMAVTELGATADGVPCYFSSDALACDAVVVINRVKSHTSFDRPIESGLTKTVAVGLGKERGATAVHSLGPRGLRDVLPELARIAISRSPIAYGIALVENTSKQLIHVEGAEPGEFAAVDERLLQVAKDHLARLPFDRLDVLVVEQIGKDISGMGMDYAVIGRTDIRGVPNPARPFIHKIVALSLTEGSHGNAQGIGVADYIPRSLAHSIDLGDLYTNSVAASVIEKARIPPVLPNDHEAIKAAVATCWQPRLEDIRLCIIRSTLHLERVLVTAPLVAELADLPGAEVSDVALPIRFSSDGVLQTRC